MKTLNQQSLAKDGLEWRPERNPCGTPVGEYVQEIWVETKAQTPSGQKPIQFEVLQKVKTADSEAQMTTTYNATMSDARASYPDPAVFRADKIFFQLSSQAHSTEIEIVEKKAKPDNCSFHLLPKVKTTRAVILLQ